jgi:hypothetical protein
MSVLVRRQLRLAFMAALQGLAGGNVVSPGDWDVPGAKLPIIKVRTGAETKASQGRFQPEYTSTTAIELQVVVEALTEGASQDALETLVAQIEDAVLGNVALIKLQQQISSVTAVPTFSSQGEKHLAGMLMTFECETFEHFDPVEINPGNYAGLQGLDVVIDGVNVFDATGTYANPPFPGAVHPAPRTSGPDGRAEGGLTIDLPQ